MTMHKLCIISRSVAPIDAIDPIAVDPGWRGGRAKIVSLRLFMVCTANYRVRQRERVVSGGGADEYIFILQ